MFPGCDRSPGFCDAHHADHWGHAGSSDLDNYVLLCRRHHRRLHEDGWRAEPDPDRPGLFQLRQPTGGPPIRCSHTTDRNPGGRIPLH